MNLADQELSTTLGKGLDALPPAVITLALVFGLMSIGGWLGWLAVAGLLAVDVALSILLIRRRIDLRADAVFIRSMLGTRCIVARDIHSIDIRHRFNQSMLQPTLPMVVLTLVTGEEVPLRTAIPGGMARDNEDARIITTAVLRFCESHGIRHGDLSPRRLTGR